MDRLDYLIKVGKILGFCILLGTAISLSWRIGDMCKDIGYAARTFGEVMETYKR